jgi:hypothetical protein
LILIAKDVADQFRISPDVLKDGRNLIVVQGAKARDLSPAASRMELKPVHVTGG